MSEWIKCDICPAQAMHLVRSTNGELTFCGHHYNKDKEALDKWGYEMIELNKKEEVPQLEKAEM
jgi:hypothetical protein